MANLKSLIWLRWNYLIANKIILFVSVLTPVFYILLMTQVANFEGRSDFLGTAINMIYSVTGGTFVSMMISEEKEKKNLRTLILSGVRQYEYFLSVLLFPVTFSIGISLLLPWLLKIETHHWLTYSVVVVLTVLVFVLLNLIISLLTRNQMQASLFSMLLYLGSTILPIVVQEVPSCKIILNYSFIGMSSRYFEKLEGFSLLDGSTFALIIWILLSTIVLYHAYRRNQII